MKNLVYSFLLSVIIAMVAHFAGFSVLMLILPVAAGHILLRSPKILVIPAVISLAVALYQENGVILEWLIWLSVFTVSAYISVIYERHYHKLAEKDLKLENLSALTEKHLEFANQISQGLYNDLPDVQEEDALGMCLVNVSRSLRTSSEQDKIRAWQMKGINDIGEIVRSSINTEANYNQIISFIVKYLNANQGGIFIINDEDENKSYIELKACYAYERQKIIQKTVEMGEGLIGSCILERDIVYLEEIPDGYVHITSGLGHSTPSSLILIPLIQGEEVFGVIEIASFNTFKEHEKEFLKKIAEIIAGGVAAIKRNAYTTRMLEESQQLTEELRAQEEEMRQNMEELQATQEQLVRESKRIEKLHQEINRNKEFLNLVIDSVPIPLFVKDRQHKMILVNKAVCELNSWTRDAIIGKSDYDFFSKEEADVFWRFEEEIFNEKKTAEKVEHAVRNGKETYTLDKKLCIETEDGEEFLVGINLDVTDTYMRNKAGS